MDEVPTRVPDFVVPLSITSDNELTANLSPALHAARVEVFCPSEAAVRALNLCGGVNPSGLPPPGEGLRPAGQRGNASLAARVAVSRPTL